MRVDQVLSSPAVTVTPDTPVKEAAILLAKFGYTALPVVNGDLELVGIVSEGDIVLDRIPGHPRMSPARLSPLPPMTVGGVMTGDVQVTTRNADVRDLVRRMRDARLRSVPVVDRDSVVGVVTLRDLVEAVAREDDRIAADVRRTLSLCADGRYDVSVHEGVVLIVDQGESTFEWPTVRVSAEQVLGVQHARVLASETGVAESGFVEPGSAHLEPEIPGTAQAEPAERADEDPGARWWAS